jgi:hypothetical protein
VEVSPQGPLGGITYHEVAESPAKTELTVQTQIKDITKLKLHLLLVQAVYRMSALMVLPMKLNPPQATRSSQARRSLGCMRELGMNSHEYVGVREPQTMWLAPYLATNRPSFR